MELTALVLAGGLGLRLRPVVRDRPKPMASFQGKPFLDFVLRFLERQGVRRVVLCVGHRADQITGHFGSGRGWGVDIEYSVEDRPAGTGGALRRARDRVSGTFLALNGDSLFDTDLDLLLARHRAAVEGGSGVLGTIALTRVEDGSRYGAVRVDGDDRIVAFEEKGESTTEACVNAGVYVLEPRLLDRVPPGKKVSLEREVFPSVIGRGSGQLLGVEGEGFFVDIGTPAGHELFRAHLEAS